MGLFQRKYPDGRVSHDWWVSWYENGRQRKKRIGPSKKSAELYMKAIDLKRVRGELGIREVKKILFPALSEKYVEWAAGRKAAYSMTVEKSAIGRFDEAFPCLASGIRQVDLEEFLSRRLKTIGPARHNRDLTILRAIFKKGVEWGYCGTNPAIGIKKLDEPPGRVRFLSDEERESLLAACPERLRRIVEIVLDTGLRRGELLSLKWEHIDFKNKQLRIERSKNGDRRDIPMTDRVFTNFKAIPKRVDTPFIFANPDGTHFKSLKTTWGTAIRKSKIKDFTFHDLRHSFASYLVMGGVDIRSVQTLMGHRSIMMTMRYSHLSPGHMRNAISVLEKPGPRTNQEQATGEEKALTS